MYSSTWQVDSRTMTNFYGDDGYDYMERHTQSAKDPLEILIELEEENLNEE